MFCWQQTIVSRLSAKQMFCLLLLLTSVLLSTYTRYFDNWLVFRWQLTTVPLIIDRCSVNNLLVFRWQLATVLLTTGKCSVDNWQVFSLQRSSCSVDNWHYIKCSLLNRWCSVVTRRPKVQLRVFQHVRFFIGNRQLDCWNCMTTNTCSPHPSSKVKLTSMGNVLYFVFHFLP